MDNTHVIPAWFAHQCGSDSDLGNPQLQAIWEHRNNLEHSRINLRAFLYYPPLTRANQYIMRHLGKKLTLGEIGSAVGLEPKYFSSFFRKKVGITLTEWLNILRVSRSMELMRRQDASITEVAFQAGFQDVVTFGRNFKKHLKMTPRDFKRSVRP